MVNMRNIIITVLLAILSCKAIQAQIDTTVWYPLQIGNYWEYKLYSSEFGVLYFSNTVIGDTTFNNGKSYRVIKRKFFDHPNHSYLFERYENGKVYIPGGEPLNNCQAGENVLYDFNVPDTTIWPNCTVYNYTDLTHRGYRGHGNLYVWATNTNAETKLFHDIRITATDTVWDPPGPTWSTKISKGIGIPQYMAQGVGIYELTGAIINGKTYGTIVNTEEKGAKTNRINITAFPNPCNNSTRINYSIEKSDRIVIFIYNMLGEIISTLVDEYKVAGNYIEQLNTAQYSSGVIFAVLQTNSFIMSHKIILLK